MITLPEEEFTKMLSYFNIYPTKKPYFRLYFYKKSSGKWYFFDSFIKIKAFREGRLVATFRARAKRLLHTMLYPALFIHHYPIPFIGTAFFNNLFPAIIFVELHCLLIFRYTFQCYWFIHFFYGRMK